MFLCLSIQNDNQNKLFWITEAKMRLKNVFVTFLPSFTGLQWTVHENKALYSSPGRVKYERFSIFQDLWGTLSLGTLTVTSIAVTEAGDSMFWWQLQDFGDGLAIFVKNFYNFFTLTCTNLQKTSPRLQFCHHHLKIVASFKSPTSKCHQHHTALTARGSPP